jgi:FKBP-type peptidyl-prolyl cis-trans isomerase FkpA
MKSLFKVSLLAATVAFAVGCQKEEASQPEVSAAQEETQVVAMTFNTEDEKASYAIGAQFATFLKQSIDKPKELGINLDSALVLKGIEDGFGEGAELSEEEIMMALQSLDQRVQEKAQMMAAEEAEKAIKVGEDFRAEFEKEDGVMKTDSGLLYQVLSAAEGESPVATDVVTVHYTGTLIDGTQFDSSVERGEPASFPLDRVIPGWTEGVQLMQVGSKYKFVIPPELAYGAQDVPNIPMNSTLVFEVELLEIVEQAEEAAQ